MNSVNLNQSWPKQPLAVVIGAGGMGVAVARRLAQRNHLLLADIDGEKLEHQAQTLRQDGMSVETQVCDVTDIASVERLGERVAEQGSFSKLVHVAGLSPSMADWRTIMAVNLLGPTLVTDALFPYIQSGSVAVLISSLSAHMSNPPAEVMALLKNPREGRFLDQLESAMDGTVSTGASYMLSKIGVMDLSERLALTWGERGGRAISLSPGLIASPQGLNEFKHASSKFEMLNQCPLRRQGNMQEIADAVEFLTSDRASYISGVDLLVDGGVRAAMRQGSAQE